MNQSDQIIGRQLDIQSIVEAIKQKNRVVIVQGMVGIGKSVVIKKVGQFFHDRESFRDGVIYFSMRDRNWVNALIFKMHNFISTNKAEDQYNEISLLKDQSLSSSEADGNKSQFNVIELREGEATDIPQIAQEFKQIVAYDKVHEIWTCLSKRECLVIVDNTELVLRDDEQQFNKFFEILLEKCPEIQLLISANEHFQHKIPETFFYYLPPLSNNHSLELLQLKSGHVITQQEIRELIQKTQMSKRNENGPKVIKLQDHHLCTILGGHQGAITLLAPLFKNRSLFEFYKTLLKMFEDPSLLQDMGEIGSYHTLKISLTAMTKNLQKTNPLAIQLLSLVSLMPGGVFEKDLTAIWGSVKWVVLAEGLMQSSLMSVKVENKNGENQGKRKYSLLHFINKFAESLLSQSKLQEFHERICQNLCIKVQHYSNNCSVEHVKHKQQQYQKEIIDIEINVWACIYRILDFNTPKEEHHKLKTKLKQNYLHHQAGDSSAEENNHKLIVHGTVDFSEVSDTCDERVNRDFDRESLSIMTPHPENVNKSISPSETDRNKGSSNNLSKLSEIKQSSTDQIKEKQPFVSLPVKVKKSHAKEFKKILNQPQIESRGRIQSLSIQFREQLKQNFRIEKRVSQQLAQIEKFQLKLMKDYPAEKHFNCEEEIHIKLIQSDGTTLQKAIQAIQEQNDDRSLSKQDQRSLVNSVEAQNQLEDLEFSDENSPCKHPNRLASKNSLQVWTGGSAASQQFENNSPRAHSVGGVNESFSIQQTYFTQKNPQDNIDCSYPQTENTQMNNTENFGDELQMQNLTYLKESEHDLTPRQIHSHEKHDELPLSVTSEISVILQRDQRFSLNDHDLQSSTVEEDINPFFSNSQHRPDEQGNLTMGFVPRSVGLQISINNDRPEDQKRTPKTLQTSLLTTPLTTIEESYYKEMTSEQKLIVTYISLLILSKRIPFALRAISLVDQHLKLKLICHANLTKLYGLCILKSKAEWIKDAFELFRRAKQIFKMVGGENNNSNIGVAQCYMIQGLLLKTKSEQIFSPVQLSQAVVEKRAIKRFEAAKQIYKEQKHLAGQLFCCSELINIKKSMKVKYMHLVNEQKELEGMLNGMFTEESKLAYGTGANRFFFIKRLDEMELSLLVEVADYHQIVRIDAQKSKKQQNLRIAYNKLFEKHSEKKPKEQWQLSTTISKKQPTKNKVSKIDARQVQLPEQSLGSEMEYEKRHATEIEGETEDNEDQKSILTRRKPNKVPARASKVMDNKKSQEKFNTQKNRQEMTSMEETGATGGEKPIRRNKYAHIQPKVNTNRKPFDHGISTDQNEQSSEWAMESLK